jgi:translation initiation factor eIF-2B subunit beta
MAISTSLLSPFDALLDNLTHRLATRDLTGSYHTAIELLQTYRVLIQQARWQTADELIRLLNIVGRNMQNAQKMELAIGNITKRMAHIIREECREQQSRPSSANSTLENSTRPGPSSMFNMLSEAGAKVGGSLGGGAFGKQYRARGKI